MSVPATLADVATSEARARNPAVLLRFIREHGVVNCNALLLSYDSSIFFAPSKINKIWFVAIYDPLYEDSFSFHYKNTIGRAR